MKEFILAIWLMLEAVIDWKYKYISIWHLIMGGAIGILFCLLQKRALDEVALACIPGVCLLVFAKLTREAIGYGDGMVFLVLGLYLSIEEILMIGFWASAAAGIMALTLLVVFRKSGKYRMAFLPFLSGIYLCSLLI